MREFVAVDAGGTSSRAIAVDETGRRLGSGTAGGGNPTSRGPAEAAAAVVAAIGEALASPAVHRGAVEVVLVAHAGERLTGYHDAIARGLAPLGLTAPVVPEGDLGALFASGTPALEGVAVIAGTGAIAGAVRGGEVVRVVDGNGWLVGDAGSGFWIGHRVARAVVDDLDGGPATRLTRALLPRFDLTEDRGLVRGRSRSLNALVTALYALRPVELSGLAPIAFALADEDEIAAAIVREATAALAALLARARAAQPDGPVVLGGSVLARGVLGRGGAASLGLTDQDPVVAPDGVVGAAVLALRGGGVVVDDAVFAALSTPLGEPVRAG